MTINFYSDLKRVQHVTFRYVLRKIIKRYIRFTSGQIILIALHSTWFIRLSRGPFWEQVMGPDHRQCNEKWWINLLYISNFFFDDGAVQENILQILQQYNCICYLSVRCTRGICLSIFS